MHRHIEMALIDLYMINCNRNYISLNLKGQYHLVTSYFYIVQTYQILNFCANNNCSKVFMLKKSKIHIRRHFPRIDMGWRPLAHVCLWLHVSSCLYSTRRRYIVSINMASIKAQHCLPISGIQIILFLDRYNQKMQS